MDNRAYGYTVDTRPLSPKGLSMRLVAISLTRQHEKENKGSGMQD